MANRDDKQQNKNAFAFVEVFQRRMTTNGVLTLSATCPAPVTNTSLSGTDHYSQLSKYRRQQFDVFVVERSVATEGRCQR